MTDFYPILKRAISALPEDTLAARRIIYARAREALERQLKSVTPALEDADILSEQLALEEAIRRIEADYQPQEPNIQQAFPPPQSQPPLSQPRMAREPAEMARQPAMQDGYSAQNEAEQGWGVPERRSPPAGDYDSNLGQLSLPPGEKRVHANRKQPKAGQNSGIAFSQSRPPSNEAIGILQRNKIFIGIALLAMIFVGGLAFLTREKSSLYASKPEATQPAKSDNNKTEGRLSSTEQAATQQQEKDNNSAILPVLARAFMVLEVPNAAPNQYQGTIIWEFSPDTASNSAEKLIRAQINFPNGGVKIDFSLTRNLDKTLDVSHTALIIFETVPSLGAVKDMSAIEWRERESQAGVVLQGTLVPVQDNFFTLGLDKSEAAIAKNLDLFRSQKWMVFEMRFANGRRGAVLLEKGATGERVIAEALRAWQ